MSLMERPGFGHTSGPPGHRYLCVFGSYYLYAWITWDEVFRVYHKNSGRSSKPIDRIIDRMCDKLSQQVLVVCDAEHSDEHARALHSL